jgi:hypothetical protein
MSLKNKNTRNKNKNMGCATQIWFLKKIALWKYEHEKNMTRLWRKTMPKISVEQTKESEGSYFYLYPFRDLAQGSF